MQGGVCYNRAVPLAMAALVGKPIVVPPEPGLMGAFGVALEVDDRMRQGLLPETEVDLEALAGREVSYGRSFACRGGRERCDRRCRVSVVGIEGRRYPFGGACNRYENLRHDVHPDMAALDLVRQRQKLVFETYGPTPGAAPVARGRIGLNRSLLVNTFYPLYANFFSRLGFDPVLPDAPAPEGVDRRGAPFCYPVELAHGFFETLLRSDPPLDAIFLPHLKAVPNQDPATNAQSQVCPLVQGETFYLRTAFRTPLARLAGRGTRLLAPLLNLSAGLEAAEAPLVAAAAQLGIPRPQAREAFAFARQRQLDCLAEIQAAGRRALAELEADPERFAVVVLSRPYTGFADEAHMGIPHKFASRGIPVIPMDALDLEGVRSKRHMYWGMGKLILKAARTVQHHPQLFGVYITNFSCGPDSFLIGYVRDVMGRKPSLTLELDSHTADAGLETRVEAFLDIVRAHRRLEAGRAPAKTPEFRPMRTVQDGRGAWVATSSGERLAVTDPRVTVLVPSMGRLGTEALVAVIRGYGLNARAGRENDEAILKTGRAHTSCKECLPLILTTGTLLDYVRNGRRTDEVVVYFMPTGSGPCRFGQYAIFMEDLIRRLRIPDVAFMALSSDNSYVGMDKDFERRAWWAVVASDTMEDIRSMLLAAAADPPAAMAAFEEEWRAIATAMETGRYGRLTAQLARSAERLGGIALRRPPAEVPVVSLTGEIFVRRDALSRQHLTERLAEKGFATRCAPVAEWVHYCDWLVTHGCNRNMLDARRRLRLRLRTFFQARYERRIRSILARSGLVSADGPGVDAVIAAARPHLSSELTGEAVLTVGGSLTEVLRHSCGVIAIGPFGCMPNRLAEAILSQTMTARDKLAADPADPTLRAVLAEVDELPFLAIETDGSPFPQLIAARLDAFLLRAGRIHERMRSAAAAGR
jgi:predicted nucleotide-binding protein (sugar kinase/HSP70/actin superfamily)